MVFLITGEKGKGKTKVLISNANDDVKKVDGNLVYLDKDNKNMYELNNKIRLININDYLITNTGEFVGFISGLVSQDHDLEKIYLDSFLKIAFVDDETKLVDALQKLKAISEKFKVDLYISISMSEEKIPEQFREFVKESL